jgi:hypothetical protein
MTFLRKTFQEILAFAKLKTDFATPMHKELVLLSAYILQICENSKAVVDEDEINLLVLNLVKKFTKENTPHMVIPKALYDECLKIKADKVNANIMVKQDRQKDLLQRKIDNCGDLPAAQPEVFVQQLLQYNTLYGNDEFLQAQLDKWGYALG